MSDRELLALIPVFDAIMSEGNLSRAAQRLGVTQSAVSQALARLRKLTNDPLFESHGRGVGPTPRAQEIASHARAALTHANAAFTPKTLDIASLKRTFVLDIGGGFDALMLPNLYKVWPRPRLEYAASSAIRAVPTCWRLLWHERFNDDAGHRWLRDTVQSVAREIREALD